MHSPFRSPKGKFFGLAARTCRECLSAPREAAGESFRREHAAERNGGSALRPEDQNREERIGATLEALPERQEEVLRAKYLEGLSVAEIAADWNETPKAVESLLSRARAAFRSLYDK
jgi:RNA polymerase sigma-70 factor, ECF subfamily